MKPVKSPRSLREGKIYYCSVSKRYVSYMSAESITSFDPKPRYCYFRCVLRRPGEVRLSYIAIVYPSATIHEIDKDLESYFQLFRNDAGRIN